MPSLETITIYLCALAVILLAFGWVTTVFLEDKEPARSDATGEARSETTTFADNYAAAIHGLSPASFQVAPRVATPENDTPGASSGSDSEPVRDRTLEAIAAAARKSPPSLAWDDHTDRYEAELAVPMGREQLVRLWLRGTPATDYSLEQWAAYLRVRLKLGTPGETQYTWIPDDADLRDVLTLLGVEVKDVPAAPNHQRPGFRLVSFASSRV